MKVSDPDLLKEVRERQRCDYCHAWIPYAHPHHIFAKGMGGGGQIDIRENLLSMCPDGLGNSCHRKFHDGNIKRQELLEISARQNGIEVEEVVRRVMELRRMKKKPT